VSKTRTFSLWVSGARPRTLPLALSPVILGAASAWWADSFSLIFTALAILVAVALQIGVNYANDYSDGIRGTDDYRVGPARLTGAGLMPPRLVLRAALISFSLAALAGVALVFLSASWWLLSLGFFALVASWYYTGGKRPYGYAGLGELVVFVFFGPVATIGTVYVQIGSIPVEAWFTGAAAGFFASAVLLVNNLRDIDQDSLASKNTLAVRLGAVWSKVIITALLVAPYVVVAVLSLVFIWAPLAFIGLFLTVPTIVIVWSGTSPRELITALQLMTITSLLFAILLGAAIAF
jgi:1,4-dihydroxy-2-naphthoate octaprenyltransferase